MSTLGSASDHRVNAPDPGESGLPDVRDVPILSLIESQQTVLSNSVRRVLETMDGARDDVISAFGNRAD